MGCENNGAKPGERRGQGRKKGVPNRKTQNLIDRAEALGVDPFEILLLFASNRWEELGYKHATKSVGIGMGQTMEIDTIEVTDRISAAKEACQYLYPKRKAMELTGKDGEKLFSITDLFKEREKQKGE